MLTHQATGPTASGQYLVTYETPGCDVHTVACICTTQAQAITEASRLNLAQAEAEKALQREHELCGLFRIRASE
jgi:hypothetical protein